MGRKPSVHRVGTDSFIGRQPSGHREAARAGRPDGQGAAAGRHPLGDAGQPEAARMAGERGRAGRRRGRDGPGAGRSAAAGPELVTETVT